MIQKVYKNSKTQTTSELQMPLKPRKDKIIFYRSLIWTQLEKNMLQSKFFFKILGYWP